MKPRRSTPVGIWARFDDRVRAEEVLRGEILRMDAQEVLRQLVTIVGRRVTAELAGVKTPKTISAWIKGGVDDRRLARRSQLDRLRVALLVALMLARRESYSAVEAWFCSWNPRLSNNRTPVQVISERDLAEEGPSLIEAARIFGQEPNVLADNAATEKARITEMVRAAAKALSTVVVAYIAGGVSITTVENWSRFGNVEAFAERKLNIAQAAIKALEERGLTSRVREWFQRPITSDLSLMSDLSPHENASPAMLLHRATARNIDRVSSVILDLAANGDGG